jgi:hypothetical protein
MELVAAIGLWLRRSGAASSTPPGSHGNGNGLIAVLSGVSSAVTVGDTQALTARLKEAELAVARGARYPLPARADPRGYGDVLLMRVNPAAASKGWSSSARAARKNVPKIT